jgi:hypothetical protein
MKTKSVKSRRSGLGAVVQARASTTTPAPMSRCSAPPEAARATRSEGCEREHVCSMENYVGRRTAAAARHVDLAMATARGGLRLYDRAGVSLENCRGGAMIIFKILAAWTIASVVTGFAVAPALSRRLRGVKFPREDE